MASPANDEEYEWTDKFGTHWQIRVVGKDGKVYSQTVTKMRYGWPHNAIENARAAVRAAAQMPEDKANGK